MDKKRAQPNDRGEDEKSQYSIGITGVPRPLGTRVERTLPWVRRVDVLALFLTITQSYPEVDR